jgi:hypothetical protein
VEVAMARRCSYAILAVLFVALACSGSALAVDVTGCSFVADDGETAVLTGDLVCPSPGDFAVQLGAMGTLDLAGFNITAPYRGVICSDKDCTITGPGTITTADIAILVPDEKVRLTLSNLTLNSGSYGILSVSAMVGSRAELTNVTIDHDGNCGVTYPSVNADGLTITGDGATTTCGIQAVKVKANNTTITGERAAAIAEKQLKLTAYTATGNSLYGAMSSGSLKLFDSTVTGNGNPPVEGADLYCFGKPPKLKNSTCNTSIGGNGGSWGVCAND